MKINRLFVAGLTCTMIGISALVFSGCQGGSPDAQTGVVPSAKETEQENIGLVRQATVSHSNEDMSAFNDALTGKDVNLCSKVSEESYKKECVTAISDILLLDEAMAKTDIAICAKIVSEEGRLKCNVEVNLKRAEDQGRLETQQEIKRISDLSNEIISQKDVKRCKELAPKYKYGCEMNILVNEAMKNKDPKVCEEASEASTVEICKKRYGELQE
jgi:hypothetical protein